jgi:glycosyltransferase involved in cell wall biosynthesis
MKKDTLKLLTVIVRPGFYSGGAENAAVALSRNLAMKKCMKVTIATMANENKEIIEGGILVKKFKNRIPPIIPSPYRNVLIKPSRLFMEEIKKEKYDVVHISNTHPAIAVAQIAKKCIKEKIPYVVSTYGIVEASTINETFKKNILVKLFSKFLINIPLTYALSKADKIAASTEYEHPILAKYKIKKEKVKVVYIGIDPEIYKENKNSINIKNKFNINDKDVIILFVGVIKENKGIDILIKAVPYLINCKILIVGGVAQKNYYEHLLKLIKNLKLKNRIIFTGFVDKDLLKSLYHGCDIFVLPTKADTLPSCIVDAMACKKPVVSTKVGGIPEVIDSTNGFLVKSGDHIELSKALQKLIDDEDLRIKMGESGYKKVKKKFIWKKVASKVLKIYKNIVTLK